MRKLNVILITIFIFGLFTIGHAAAEVVVFEGIFERGNAIFEQDIGSKATGNKGYCKKGYGKKGYGKKGYGKKGYGKKGYGMPVTQFENFPGSSGEAALKVCNVTEAAKISSATISINGNVVLGPTNFNQNVGCIEKTVNLNDGDNTLGVLLKSKPGGKLSIEILQPDSPPSVNVCDGDRTYPDTEIERIYVGEPSPVAISITPDGKYVYMTHPLSDTVSIIPLSDPNSEIETIYVGDTPAGVSVSPDGKYAYVTHMYNALSVISIADNNTVIKTITVGNGHRAVSVSPDGKYVYLSDYGDSTVSIISTDEILQSDNPVIETTDVGYAHRGIAVSPDGEYIYVSNYDVGTVSVISVSDNYTEIDTITVGNKPWGVAVSPDGKYVYVTNSGDSTVSVLSICDDNAEIGTIDVAAVNPAGVAVSSDSKNVYVSNYVQLGTISVFGSAIDE